MGPVEKKNYLLTVVVSLLCWRRKTNTENNQKCTTLNADPTPPLFSKTLPAGQTHGTCPKIYESTIYEAPLASPARRDPRASCWRRRWAWGGGRGTCRRPRAPEATNSSGSTACSACPGVEGGGGRDRLPTRLQLLPRRLQPQPFLKEPPWVRKYVGGQEGGSTPSSLPCVARPPASCIMVVQAAVVAAAPDSTCCLMCPKCRARFYIFRLFPFFGSAG